MTTENNAPLTDDVEQMITEIVNLASNYAPDVYWECIKGHAYDIRAHIAAQAEKIDKLEDENKRLREALLAMLDCPSFLDQKTVPPGTDANGSPHTAVVNMSVSWLKISMARAALAQTEGEKHE